MPGCVGLFALEDIPKDRFIMEYTGEYYNTDCRYNEFVTMINEKIGRSYGFDVHFNESIDAVNTGNLMRFSN